VRATAEDVQTDAVDHFNYHFGRHHSNKAVNINESI